MSALDRETYPFNILQFATIRSKTLSTKLFTASSQDQGTAQPPDRYQWSNSNMDYLPNVTKTENNFSNGHLYILDPQTVQWSEAPFAARVAQPILTAGWPGSIHNLRFIG